MSQPNGHVWVDPDGVTRVGDAYADHLARYDGYLRQLYGLRDRFAPAWGDDEIGNQFKDKFDQTIDVVEGIILGVRGSVEYAAVGLRLSGQGYGQADDDAKLAGRTIGGVFDDLPEKLPRWRPGASEPEGIPDKLPRNSPALFSERDEDETTLARPGLLFTVDSTDPLQRAYDAQLPAEPTRFSPAISAFRGYPTTGVRIDGDPVPAGYQLRSLTTLPDGTSRADVNHYDAIVPLGGRTVTGPDGRPLDSDGDQFFLVKPKANLDFDPFSPDYQPLLVSFRSDGSAAPLLVDPT
ncbi:hypothetical protein [Micromonospora cathayae]|uniref:WXG100 family type VII secretion target n=1 Tax=Micromonospora cathayae TaxID=3028804 RepID=A0ABY7ZP66_9ACTN|nr:hypothetical protein [Micromonospora sp. HUAS 3]WDZ83744.1 hypothetical protein PVK37_25265 [Micromonospora sp. HUAS 3]